MAKIPKKSKNQVKNGVYNFPLRLTEKARDNAVTRAETNKRSLNSQINFELETNDKEW